jgi:23S rRNA (adenine2503-C2)-methyltransferase
MKTKFVTCSPLCLKISQVIHFEEILRQRGEHVTNLVFMGMGEPMANYDEMIRAVKF